MSKYAGATTTLALVQKLRATVQDIAAREAQATRELRTRTTAERQRLDAAIAKITQQLSAEAHEADSIWQTAQQAARSKHDNRKARIIDAHKAAKKQRLDEIETAEGNRKFKLQTQTLQLTRDRKNGLAATETAFEQFKATLAEVDQALVELEEKARRSFGGYGGFVRALRCKYEPSQAESEPDEYKLIEELKQLLTSGASELKRFRRFPLPWIFRYRWFLLILVLLQFAVPPVLARFGIDSFSYERAAISTGGLLVLGFILHYFGKRQGQALAMNIAKQVTKARWLHGTCWQKCDARHTQDLQAIEDHFQKTTDAYEQEWHHAVEDAARMQNRRLRQVEEKLARSNETNDRLLELRLSKLERERTATVTCANSRAESRITELRQASDALVAKLAAACEEQVQTLLEQWRTEVVPAYEALTGGATVAEKGFPPWQSITPSKWAPPAHFEQAARFGQLELDIAKLSDSLPQDPRFTLPGPEQLSVPLLLSYPNEGSIAFETAAGGRDQAIACLNNIILRLLSVTPPGKVDFTVIDPVGLGESFAGVMHLADHADHLINSRIWTQTTQIEQRLAELNEHMEKVIQMYLRNEYQTISEYNEQAGNMAEKYHFLVVADFPSNFSDTAARRLLSIASSGARCGVYTLILWDSRLPVPQDFVPDTLRQSSICIGEKGDELVFGTGPIPGTRLLLDSPPSPEFVTEFIQKVGRASIDSARIEVPFTSVAPSEKQMWTDDVTSELRVPIGRTGATKFQYLAIGKGTRQHALIAGKTGSGKSTLFHVVITNLALWCSPDQVEFYLIDFKKGVEFKCYADNRLPHARVVAIESDREFGLSVLERLDEELKRRGELFRELGVQDLAGYRKAGGTEAIPRSLLIVDEFQEFFVEEDRIAQSASVLLDRIVRQGRAFGIHVLLGSQTLGGAYTVARTTLGQMVIRIALQCNEADAYLIMDDSNAAPRLLSRPGEGIYNDAAGALQGNSPFQAVWLSDDLRDEYLKQVRYRADCDGVRHPAPVVFEGNAPADVAENPALHQLLKADAIVPTTTPRIWLGAPNSIKGPTEVTFRRQSGNHLIIVGQRDEAALAAMSAALISLAAQYPIGAARFVLFDGTAPGSPHREFLEQVIGTVPHEITVVQNNDVAKVMGDLAAERKRRNDDPAAADAPPTFIFILNLQKFSRLKYEEDFGFSGDSEAPANPGLQFNDVICEGSRVGLHVIATCDTANNVNRFLSRKALSEFGMRVLFQMSANDSALLVDNPKASTLGLHRALLYNEQEAHLELFRPYALPAKEWLHATTQSLARLAKS